MAEMENKTGENRSQEIIGECLIIRIIGGTIRIIGGIIRVTREKIRIIEETILIIEETIRIIEEITEIIVGSSSSVDQVNKIPIGNFQLLFTS